MTVGLDAPDDEHEGQLTPAQLAALAAMDGGFDPADLDPEDLYLSPPEEWLAMTPEEWLEAAPPPSRTVPEVLDAGFTHRDGGQGLGFAAGGVLDQMEPGGAPPGRPRWSWPRSASCPPAARAPMAVPVSTWKKRSPRR